MFRLLFLLGATALAVVYYFGFGAGPSASEYLVDLEWWRPWGTFVRWLQQFEPHTEVPDDTVFGRMPERKAPHIYTEQEVIDSLRGVYANNLGERREEREGAGGGVAARDAPTPDLFSPLQAPSSTSSSRTWACPSRSGSRRG